MRKYYDEIARIAGNVVTVKAGGVGYDELAAVVSDRGTSLAQVIRLEGEYASLQIFAGTQGVSTRDKVRFLGHPMQMPSPRRSWAGSSTARAGRGTGVPRSTRRPSPSVRRR